MSKPSTHTHFYWSDGSIELIKWLAMIFMTVDHINRFFYVPLNYPAYCIGRLAMPLFTFVFAYNLARPRFIFPEQYKKAFPRLLFFGCLATPAYGFMLHLQGPFPLNIMFAFMATAAVLFFIQKQGFYFLAALSCFFIGGVLVEYSWGGILLGIAFWLGCKTYYFWAFVMGAASFYFLSLLNGNDWGLGAILIIAILRLFNFQLPRIRFFFWIYYPLHLSLLAGWKLLS